MKASILGTLDTVYDVEKCPHIQKPIGVRWVFIRGVVDLVMLSVPLLFLCNQGVHKNLIRSPIVKYSHAPTGAKHSRLDVRTRMQTDNLNLVVFIFSVIRLASFVRAIWPKVYNSVRI